MRDRFAMAAMVADLTREGAPTNPVDAKYAALRAYGLADAMLAARGVSAPQPAIDYATRALLMDAEHVAKLYERGRAYVLEEGIDVQGEQHKRTATLLRQMVSLVRAAAEKEQSA